MGFHDQKFMREERHERVGCNANNKGGPPRCSAVEGPLKVVMFMREKLGGSRARLILQPPTYLPKQTNALLPLILRLNNVR